MRYRLVVFIFLSMVLISKTYGSTAELFQGSLKEPHQISKMECSQCHVDINIDPAGLKPMLNSKCVRCHSDLEQSEPHPVDISTNISIPADMPLVNGRLGCITCHFFHPSSAIYGNRSGNLLRRTGRGAVFCNACHQIDEKGHVAFENIHRDSLRLSDGNGRLDMYTLQCAECHDRYLDRSFGSVTEGRQSSFNKLSNHPVGVSLDRLAVKKPRKFNSPHALPKEIRLFNGKLGCGTCHNTFSKEKSMLVMNNWRSQLCLRCHIK